MYRARRRSRNMSIGRAWHRSTNSHPGRHEAGEVEERRRSRRARKGEETAHGPQAARDPGPSRRGHDEAGELLAGVDEHTATLILALLLPLVPSPPRPSPPRPPPLDGLADCRQPIAAPCPGSIHRSRHAACLPRPMSSPSDCSSLPCRRRTSGYSYNGRTRPCLPAKTLSAPSPSRTSPRPTAPTSRMALRRPASASASCPPCTRRHARPSRPSLHSPRSSRPRMSTAIAPPCRCTRPRPPATAPRPSRRALPRPTPAPAARATAGRSR